MAYVCAKMAANLLIWFCSFLSFYHHWATLQHHNVVFYGPNDGCVTPANAVKCLPHLKYNFTPIFMIYFKTALKRIDCNSDSDIVFPISKITTHVIVTLALPSHTFLMDLTVHMDIKVNPDPETVITVRNATGSMLLNSNVPAIGTIEYSRSDLFKLQSKYTISEDLYCVLKTNDILRTMEKRSGSAVRSNIYKTPVHLTLRDSVDTKNKGGVNLHTLLQVPQKEEYRIPTRKTTNDNKAEQYSWSAFGHLSRSNGSNLTTIPRSPLVKPVAHARSVKNKSFIIKDFVVYNNTDILAIIETWLQADISNQITVNNICPTGFVLHHLPRAGHRGGGVALPYKNRFRLKKLSPDISSNSFEFTDCISYF